MAYYKLWVAEDGSTYPAFKYDTDGDGFINTGQVRLSAEYAMHYEEAFVLAQPVSAYDARKELASGTDKQKHEAARSPAVDAADDNAYDYDTTSTLSVKRLESLRENFPENYHPDTVIDMSQPDIGYHYLRRIADDDPINDSNREVIITFKQPEPGPGGIQEYNLSKWSKELSYWVELQPSISINTNGNFVDHEIKDHLPTTDNYRLKVETEPINGNVGQSGPEINVLIDTEF